MGKILTIRLSAVTYNTDEVFHAWPYLCALAWPGKGELIGGAWRPAAVSKKLGPPVEAETPGFSVQDLAHNLMEEFQFGDWEPDVKQEIEDGMQELQHAVASLEKALEDWQPQAANTATDALEDALDKLERKLAK